MDEKELVKYLKNGHLGGAMLDVFENEPLGDLTIFTNVDDLILTPHIAGLTGESNIRVSKTIAEKVIDCLMERGQ